MSPIHRRITKLDMHGEVVEGSSYDSARPSCRHEDIDY